MVGVLRVLETESLDVTTEAMNIASRDMPWTARIVTNAPMYAVVGHEEDNPVATTDDFLILEYQETFFAVGAGEEISFVSSAEGGTVWVSRVGVSSF